MQQNLIDAARAVIAADRAGELTDELINALEAAANAEAGPAGAPVAWRYIRRANGEVILDSIELNPWMPELLEDIRQHYDVEEIPLYATPQPATSAEWTAPVLSLIALAQAVSIALDDSEERQGDEGRVHLIDSDNFDEVCNALEALEELPDDKPGYTLGPAGKAEWALRGLLTREEKQHD